MIGAQTMRSRWAATLVGAVICALAVFAVFFSTGTSRRGTAAPPPPPTIAPSLQGGRPFNLTAESVLGLFVVGVVSGTFGSMLGMGGGVLKMSCLLLFFGLHQEVSRFAALLSYFVVAAGASYRYWRLKLIMRNVVRILIPSSIIGIILGAVVGLHLSRSLMIFMLGAFLVLMAVEIARRLMLHHLGIRSMPGGAGSQKDKGDSKKVSASIPADWKLALCGFPGGFLSAMLGISGGIVTNPLQQVLADIPIKNSIANTLAKAAVTVPIACLIIGLVSAHAGRFEFWDSVMISVCVIPGSAIGSQLGPALVAKMSPVAVHVLFGIGCFFMGLDMLFLG